MLDANQEITHVFKEYDSTKRTNVLKTEVLKGSWFRAEQILTSDTSAKPTDVVKVRIPIPTASDIPIINVLDMMVLGNVDITGLSEGQITKQYPNSFVVSSVTVNNKSRSGYSNHVRVSGS